jgi:hypothetical protein
MISPTDFLHPSPAPHSKTSQAFLIYFPKCPSFSTIPIYKGESKSKGNFLNYAVTRKERSWLIAQY